MIIPGLLKSMNHLRDYCKFDSAGSRTFRIIRVSGSNRVEYAYGHYSISAYSLLRLF